MLALRCPRTAMMVWIKAVDRIKAEDKVAGRVNA
jgi:hypothetical protein